MTRDDGYRQTPTTSPSRASWPTPPTSAAWTCTAAASCWWPASPTPARSPRPTWPSMTTSATSSAPTAPSRACSARNAAHRQPAGPLDRRPHRRHPQLPPRHRLVGDPARLRDRRARRGRAGLGPGDGAALVGGPRPRRLDDRALPVDHPTRHPASRGSAVPARPLGAPGRGRRTHLARHRAGDPARPRPVPPRPGLRTRRRRDGVGRYTLLRLTEPAAMTSQPPPPHHPGPATEQPLW